MTTSPPLVIVGTGLAGYTLAKTWRRLDSTTPLVLITEDDGSFYTKPQLSTALHKGLSAEDLRTHTAEAMADQCQARVLTHTRVVGLEAPQRRLMLDDGTTLTYDQCVLATGAAPQPFCADGDAVADVLQVNSLDDYARYRACLKGAKRVVLVGAGLIGCEFAYDLAQTGHDVLVVETGSHPMPNALPKAVGEAYGAALTSVGVRWRFGERVDAVRRANDGSRYQVALRGGGLEPADCVVAAVGLSPRRALAEHAGLACHRGILVDGYGQTSQPGVWALGDAVEREGQVRYFVPPLRHSAEAMARSLAGEPTAIAYPPMPVTLKTPKAPLVLCGHTVSLPDANAEGLRWSIDWLDEGNAVAQWLDETGLQGVVLLGPQAAKQRMAWVSSLAKLPG